MHCFFFIAAFYYYYFTTTDLVKWISISEISHLFLQFEEWCGKWNLSRLRPQWLSTVCTAETLHFHFFKPSVIGLGHIIMLWYFILQNTSIVYLLVVAFFQIILFSSISSSIFTNKGPIFISHVNFTFAITNMKN